MNSLQTEIEQILKIGGIEFYKFEAKQFIKEYYGKLSEEEIFKKVTLRTTGYPLQYIFKNWEFYGLPFCVGEGVLIPRADTEILVDAALDILKGTKNAKVVDLCSGSGCIAIAIEKNSNASVWAVEFEKNAYLYLEKNIKLNHSEVVPVFADATKYTGKFNMVVSNPPYIETETLSMLEKEVQYEPKTALDGGKDGLDFYRKITANANKLLNKNGTLIFEIGYNQKDSVTNILKTCGFENIKCVKDLDGNSRVIFGTYKGI